MGKLDENEIRRIMSEEFAKALQGQPQQEGCVLDIKKDDHDEEHRFLKSLMGVSAKIDNIKWVLFSDTVKTLWRFFIICSVIGILVWVRNELKY